MLFNNVIAQASRRNRNLIRAFRIEAVGAAICEGVIGDHRVMESLEHLGPVAARIVVELETRRGKKLSRQRVQELARTFKRLKAA